jgi:hypothetical protein
MSDWAPPSREELELEQIKADIALKRVQAAGEPWKTVSTVVGAMAAGFTALGILIGYLIRGSLH